MTKKSIRDSILADIHEKGIRPRPRWQFIALHILLWGSFSITLLAGIIAVSFLFLEINMPERVFMDYLSDRPVLFLRILPFIWGIGALIALTLGSLLFSKTGRGYRFSLITMMGVLIFGSLLGGWILYATHVPHFGERQMQRFVGGYGDMRVKIRGGAPRPEDGHLLVRITRRDPMFWVGQEINGHEWTVTLTCSDAECEKNASEITVG